MKNNVSPDPANGAGSKKLRGPAQQPLRPHHNCYWVIPGKLMAGEYPGAAHDKEARQRLNGYLDAGVNFFIDLTEPTDPLKPYIPLAQDEAARRGQFVEHRRMAIVDMDIPDKAHMTNILNTIDQAIEQGKTVYVHCWGGIGRTGTVIGSYLVRHGNSGEEALKELARLWQNVAKRYYYPNSPQTLQQLEFVRDWSETDNDQ